MESHVVFNSDPIRLDFVDWLRKPLKTGTIRILSGFRASGKTTLVQTVLPALEATAPSVATVAIDLESVDFQAMRTADLMWGHVVQRCPKGRFRLILDEPGLFADLVPFLQRVRQSGRCASILLICSNSWRFEEISAEFPVAHYHLRDGLAPALDSERMDAVWYKTFVRDVLCPSRSMDGTGVWHLGSWLSEHFGEVTSLRKISQELSQYGTRVSHPTVDAYIRAFQNAFLLDRVECLDLFSASPSRTGFRLAVNHPRLFVHAFSVDRKAMAKAIQWNEAYRQLRREHDVVYYPKCGHAAFATLAPDGSPVCWLLKGGKPVLRDR